MSEEKNRKEIEKGKRPTHLGPQAQLICTAAQPAPLLVVYLGQASTQLRAGHAEAADDGQTTQLPPCLLQPV